MKPVVNIRQPKAAHTGPRPIGAKLHLVARVFLSYFAAAVAAVVGIIEDGDVGAFNLFGRSLGGVSAALGLAVAEGLCVCVRVCVCVA